MDKFIYESDYETIIKLEELNLLIEGNPNTLLRAETFAIKKIRKKINRQYDADLLFSPIPETALNTDDDTRDETLVEYTIYFVLHMLYTKIAKKAVPEDRYDQYKEALEFFNDVKKDMISPGWPQKTDESGNFESLGIRMNGETLETFYP